MKQCLSVCSSSEFEEGSLGWKQKVCVCDERGVSTSETSNLSRSIQVCKRGNLSKAL